jgi:hypothetical protein
MYLVDVSSEEAQPNRLITHYVHLGYRHDRMYLRIQSTHSLCARSFSKKDSLS